MGTTGPRRPEPQIFGRLSENPVMETNSVASDKTELVAAMCNLLPYAFDAYQHPKQIYMDGVAGSSGFKERTNQDTDIHYLNEYLVAEWMEPECRGVHFRKAVGDVVEGILKIYLEGASDVKDEDTGGFWDKSDPFVVFSAGSNAVTSRVLNDKKDPKWNSTHYLVIKKRYIRSDFDGKLHVALYDDDSTRGFVKTFYPSVFRGDSKDRKLLGEAELNLADLKRPGVHSHCVTLKLKGKYFWSQDTETPLRFTTEFMTFAGRDGPFGGGSVMGCCVEARGHSDFDGVNGWLWGDIVTRNELTPLRDFPKVSEHKYVPFQYLAFVSCPATDTEAWIHINRKAKALLIAFRGSEGDARGTSAFVFNGRKIGLKDVATDIRATQTYLGEMGADKYCLRPTEALNNGDARVHSGFRCSYLSVREAILEIAYNLTGWSSQWTIYLTGHSLGACLATFCTFELSNRKDSRGSGPQIAMINVGSLKVGNSMFVDLYKETCSSSYRVLNELDLLTRAPPLQCYVHIPREISLREDRQIMLEGSPLSDYKDENVFGRVTNRSTRRAKPATLKGLRKKFGIPNFFQDTLEKHLDVTYAVNIGKGACSFFGVNYDMAADTKH